MIKWFLTGWVWGACGTSRVRKEGRTGDGFGPLPDAAQFPWKHEKCRHKKILPSCVSINKLLLNFLTWKHQSGLKQEKNRREQNRSIQYPCYSVSLNFHVEHVINRQGLTAGFPYFILFSLINEFLREHYGFNTWGGSFERWNFIFPFLPCLSSILLLPCCLQYCKNWRKMPKPPRSRAVLQFPIFKTAMKVLNP